MVRNLFHVNFSLSFLILPVSYSFKPVISRLGLRPILSEKYIEAFIGYEKDLDEVKDTYEQFKVSGTVYLFVFKL